MVVEKSVLLFFKLFFDEFLDISRVFNIVFYCPFSEFFPEFFIACEGYFLSSHTVILKYGYIYKLICVYVYTEICMVI